MEIKGLSKTHQNIIKKLIKNNIVEKRIEDNYNLYITNKKYLDNEKFFFSDSFNLCNEDEFLLFEENLKYNILNILVRKLKKRVFKSKIKPMLSNFEVVYNIQNILFEEMDGDINKMFKIVKENIIFQDSIDREYKLIKILKELTDIKEFSYEYVSSEIKKEEKRLNKKFVFKETKEKGVYVFIGNVYAKNLIHKITPKKYCINQGSYFNYCSNPYSIIFDFNKEISNEGSIYFTYVLDKIDEPLSIIAYNQKNKDKSSDFFPRFKELILEERTIKEYFIDSKYEFYGNNLKAICWILADVYLTENKDVFYFYLDKFRKKLSKDDLLHFNESFLHQIKRSIFHSLNNIEYINEDITFVINKVKRIKDINLSRSENSRILEIMSNFFERNTADFEDYKKAKLIIDTLLLNKSFEIYFKEDFNNIYMNDSYYFYFDFYMHLNVQEIINENEKEILKTLVLTAFKADLEAHIIDLKPSLTYLKEKILNENEYQELLKSIIYIEKNTSNVIYIKDEMNEENAKSYYQKPNIKEKITHAVINEEKVLNDRILKEKILNNNETYSFPKELMEEIPEVDNNLLIESIINAIPK